MNDWQELVVCELKAVNRRLDALNVKLDGEIDPIKKHVTQVRFTTVLVSALVPVVMAIWKIFA